ncbi:MAG TPA: FAD/NAD(P)-binding oxidoreductase [Terriglobales bacterium]|nr:FAD/NAD(P)-binding oxidoreductase [Terriglobales bacterium]
MSNRLQSDVLVIGGGPAGMAAAACAAESGTHVIIVDDNPGLGGQIWRGQENGGAPPEVARWYGRLRNENIHAIRGARVFEQPEPGCLLAETWDGIVELRYGSLVLCTGARERFLPFPGWTLPNVMGAGGLQALAKAGLPIAGKRVVVAGSGPLLLAVAAYLHEHEARVILIAEQASSAALRRFATRLLVYPGKVFQAIRLKLDLPGVRYRSDCWPVAAHGTDKLTGVTVQCGARQETIACDYLACGFGLVPNTELAALLGARLKNGYVDVDEWQQTSLPDIYCAGEPTGIGGLELSLSEGQIAGYAAAGKRSNATEVFAERKAYTKFATLLEKTFSLREELRMLPQDDTILCRCEDVRFGRARAYGSWRASKLHSRCGMGPCQGRVCGSAAEFLLGWMPESVRPPLFPVRVENLAAVGGSKEIADY